MTSSSAEQDNSRLQAISRDRCEELLARCSTGRIAWNAGDGPELLPVSYAMYNSQVVFRTSPYGVLSQLSRQRSRVAFEVDEIDQEHGTGWSVVVRGTAEGVVQDHDLARLWSMERITPWATGTRNLFVAITAQTVSGRRVKAPFAD
jgi:nitroimidazol reductase NimA-like FMN-containing flavoprotein (pyridoxamine 5'-phosphate oxidase superfamily)